MSYGYGGDRKSINKDRVDRVLGYKGGGAPKVNVNVSINGKPATVADEQQTAESHTPPIVYSPSDWDKLEPGAKYIDGNNGHVVTKDPNQPWSAKYATDQMQGLAPIIGVRG